MKYRTSRQDGFSLIEVALALLVVSVGLIAAVGMLPGSLDNSKRATDDTQQALFADYVLNTFRTYASSGAYTWSGATAFTDQPVYIPAVDKWDPATKQVVKGSGTITFTPVGSTIEEMSIAYDLSFHDQGPDMKRAELQTWMISSSNTNTFRDFYADFYRGDMK